MNNKFPTYEEVKETDRFTEWRLFTPTIGGYFRLVTNEDGEKNIALDYLEGGYLRGIIYKFSETHRLNHLYKLNKKNYTALMKMYKNIIDIYYKEISDYIAQ